MPLRSLYSSNSSYYLPDPLANSNNTGKKQRNIRAVRPGSAAPVNNDSNRYNVTNLYNEKDNSNNNTRRPTNNKNPAGGKVSVLSIFDNSSNNKKGDTRRVSAILPNLMLAKPSENLYEGYLEKKYKRPMSAYSWRDKSIKAIEKMVHFDVENKKIVAEDEEFEREDNEIDEYWKNIKLNKHLLTGINLDVAKKGSIASTFYPEPEDPKEMVYAYSNNKVKRVSVQMPKVDVAPTPINTASNSSALMSFTLESTKTSDKNRSINNNNMGSNISVQLTYLDNKLLNSNVASDETFIIGEENDDFFSKDNNNNNNSNSNNNINNNNSKSGKHVDCVISTEKEIRYREPLL